MAEKSSMRLGYMEASGLASVIQANQQQFESARQSPETVTTRATLDMTGLNQENKTSHSSSSDSFPHIDAPNKFYQPTSSDSPIFLYSERIESGIPFFDNSTHRSNTDTTTSSSNTTSNLNTNAEVVSGGATPPLTVDTSPATLLNQSETAPETAINSSSTTSLDAASSAFSKEATLLKQPVAPSHPYNHIDVDWSVDVMDKLFKASFYDFIKDERNCECTAQHLEPLLKEYKLLQVVNGLRWVIKGWRPESIAKLLKIVFKTWLPDLAGVVFAYLSDELEFRQKICLVMAFLLLREPATSAGIFLASFALSKQWTKDDKPNPITEAFQRGNSKTDLRAAKATELVSYLDCVLEWEEAYFQEFTFWFLKSFKNIDVAMKNMSTTSTNDDHHQQKMGPGALSESVSSSSFENANVSQVSLNSHETNEDDSAASSSSSEVEVMLKYLSSYYSSDIAINDYKLALADFRLALAEYNLSMVSHRINCFNCRNGLPCTEDNRFPSQLSMGASTNSLALDGVDEEGEEEEMDNDDDDDKLDLNKYGHVAIPNVEDDIIAQLHLQE